MATQSLAFSRNARTFETQHSSLSIKGMAGACLTVSYIPDGIPCNPAMTPLNSKSSLAVEALLSNGYSAIDNIRKLLSGQVTQELVDTLFTKGKIVQIEASADIDFHSKYLNGQFTPVSIKGFSVIRNEANPEVDLYSIEENGYTFQSGYEVYRDLFVGLQIRTLNRKFIKQRFKLAVLGTQAGQDLLKPKTQTVTFFEPGLTYFLGSQWKPRVSLFVANLGTATEKFDEIAEPVEGQIGFGLSPPLDWGDLDLSLEYRSMSYEEDDLQKLRFGAMYRFGSMYLTGGIDSNGISGGVLYRLDNINAGVVYSTTQFMNQEENFYTQTVYVQLGWQL
jgi:hypothetical protein